ncbi:hypothetical protein RJ55_08725 [Drechmeria coniospora]|nr:hypothetical protein RJ55_08725 [Drechmeria coniospora]
MSLCKHSVWLRVLKKGAQVVLEESDRLQRLLTDIDNVDDPIGTILLIGNQTKCRIGAALGLDYGALKGRPHHSECHLHVTRLQDKRPILLIDGDISTHNRLPRSCTPHTCHETMVKPIFEGTSTVKSMDTANEIYSRVIMPLADVVCMFVADIGGIQKAVHHLTAWAANGKASTSPIRPALVLVVPRGQKSNAESALNTLSGHQGPDSLCHYFQQISVLCLSNQKKQLKQCQPVPKELLRLMDVVQGHKLQSGWLFSTIHAAEFLRGAADAITRSPKQQFDFIKASREKFPLPRDLRRHLLNFLTSYDETGALKYAMPLVASSFILDQYPPEMHKFNPRDVFHTLYRDVCVGVSEDLRVHRDRASLPILPFDVVHSIEDAIIEQYHEYETIGTSKLLRKRHLAQARSHLIFSTSEDTCLCCLQRRPQYRLPCGHWTCQVCVRIFYDQDHEDPLLFVVGECVLCGENTGDVRIRMKPDTATTRVLSIDGGGTRGRAPLEFLKALQHYVALPYPVQRNFDVVYGTSSGAMIACALFYNAWSVDKCIDYFELSSRLAFDRRRIFKLFQSMFGHIPVISTVIQLVVSMLSDSKYSGNKLEMILQDVYGQDRSMTDSRKASEMGALLGVTLTSTDDTSTFILTNYNGVGQRQSHSGYDILNLRKSACDVPLWEILRCCTAAPYYFTPHCIKDVGTFQDGGLTFNNPAAIALKEAASLFPAAPEPSIVVSLGTGSGRPKRINNEDTGNFLQNTFAARLFRAFWKQGDSTAAWKQLLSHQKLGDGQGFFRFDIKFEANQPALDDVGSMIEIGRMAHEAALGSSAMKQLAKRIRAELFVFKLDISQLPQFFAGAFECVGHISCRLRPGSVEFMTLMNQLSARSASFNCQGQSFSDCFREYDDIDEYVPLRQTICFHVPSRQHQFGITLQDGPSVFNISGSPFTLEWLAEQQATGAYFGTVDHRKRTRVNEVTTQLRKRRRIR